MLNDKLSGLNTPRVRSANDSFEESEKIIINNLKYNFPYIIIFNNKFLFIYKKRKI